ncbi:Protein DETOXIFICATION 30 [Hondaea fermentalgiana]|uniref:Protein DETOXIFICATION 30 n=1 Tax=Hondaea fermentalgiana TaxID=2315210 RepID=A0A2R5GTY3_9STRA|nr:Protein DETOXIFICATION 30 [Hondaea fermentalgiana]|eukprot:GBG33779.1 Protein DETOXIFICATION 30 [Hondaea fermentalgiana]
MARDDELRTALLEEGEVNAGETAANRRGGGAGADGASDNERIESVAGETPPRNGSEDEAPGATSSRAETKSTTWTHELGEILYLGVGLFLARASWVVIKTTDTSIIGHVSTEALEASAVADLWMSSTGVLTMGGVLGVFVGQAVGAGNFRLASIWLQVSLVSLVPIVIFVMLLWFLTGPILQSMGVDAALIPQASYYGAVLALAIPGRTLMGQFSQFLSAHGRVKPEANVSVFAAILNLTLGLTLVLGIPFKGWLGFGFAACPWVTAGTETMQLVVFWFIYGYLQSLPSQLGWEGWHFEEVTWARLREFFRLYIPAVLSSCSDYWRMSVIGIFAATLGNTDLAVFNASYRILWMSLTIVGCIAVTITILMSIVLVVCFAVQYIALVFSNDPEVIDLFEKSSVPIALTLLMMNLSVFLEQIPVAMGQTRTTFFAGVVGSWAGQVPCSYLFITFWRHDLTGLYTGVATGYFLLCVILGVIIFRTDWDAVVRDAQRRNAT